MYCVKCSKKIDDGAVFCQYCGTDQIAYVKVMYGNDDSIKDIKPSQRKAKEILGKVSVGMGEWLDENMPDVFNDVLDYTKDIGGDVLKRGGKTVKRTTRNMLSKLGVRKKTVGETIEDIIYDVKIKAKGKKKNR